MFTETIENLEVICGQLPYEPVLRPTFDELVIDFFSSLSKLILNNKSFDRFSDLKAFGFWCRKRNLQKLAISYESNYLMMGRGIVFHVSPSNVALNFAYSLAFGMLSGNTNIVRLPTKAFDQVKVLIDLLNQVLNQEVYGEIKRTVCLIKYERCDKISGELSLIANARVIWGGDTTINLFKSYPTRPRCVDIMFSNRYSATLIDPSVIRDLSEKSLLNLVDKFFKDSYLMDQKGCSSSQAVIWLGKNNLYAKTRFWNALDKFTVDNYEADLSVTSQKFHDICMTAAVSNLDYSSYFKSFKLVRYNLSKNLEQIQKLRGSFGVFAEISIDSLNELIPIAVENFQTLSYFGLNKLELRNFIYNKGLIGIDRFVPVGRAFDIGPIWDGHDVIKTLSRIIGD